MCGVRLRNYRKDGTQFWNEIFLEPVRDAAGTLTHFVGFHRDVGERERAAGAQSAVGLPVWVREDRLTGLYTRNYFDGYILPASVKEFTKTWSI